MTIKYAILSKMLPDRDGKIKLRLGHKLFTELEEAEREADIAFRQNLPYRSKVVEIHGIDETWEQYIVEEVI